MADESNKKKSKMQSKGLLSFLVLGAVVFLPSSILLGVGMLPTLVATFIVKKNKGTKSATVGAMNIAGCTPFFLELWHEGHTIEKALEILTAPATITVMYTAATVGYILYWTMLGLVTGILYQKGVQDRANILKMQKDLVDRWGREVTGEVKLNEYGFPIEVLKDQKKKQGDRD